MGKNPARVPDKLKIASARNEEGKKKSVGDLGLDTCNYRTEGANG